MNVFNIVALQKWSHTRLCGIICILLVSFFSILWWLGFQNVQFSGADQYDYAQMGQEILKGNGFSTIQIFPRHVKFFHEKGYLYSNSWPNLYRYPLPTIYNAFFQIFFQDRIRASVFQSGIWFLLTIPVLFYFTIKMSNLPVAVLVSIFYAADPILFRLAYDGLTEPLATFLVVCVFCLNFSSRASRWTAFGIGLVCGLAYLTRTQLVILIPFVIIHMVLTRPKTERWSYSVFILLGILCTTFPWGLRNFSLTGDPFFSFSQSRNLVLGALPKHADLDMQLHAPTETSIVLQLYGKTIIKKIYHNIWPTWFTLTHWRTIFDHIFWPIFVLFLSSFFHIETYSSRKYKLFKWEYLLLVLLNMFVSAMFHHDTRFYVPFRPYILLIGIYELFMFFDQLLFNYGVLCKRIALSMIGLFGCLLFISLFMQQRYLAIDVNERESWRILQQLTSAESIIASDVSHKVTNIDRRSLRLPAYPKELLEIDLQYLEIDYVLLSKNVLDAVPSEATNMWWETYDDYGEFVGSAGFLAQFQVECELPNGAVLFSKRHQGAHEILQYGSSDAI